MESNLQEQYEKVLLLVFGLIALVVSGLLIFKSMGAEDDSSDSGGGGDSKEKVQMVKTKAVNKAGQLLSQGSTWILPTKSDKPNPFSASNPILFYDGKNFDMQDPNSEKLWPPVDNAWWYKYKLDPTSPTCRDEDPDDDGFTNLAEFENQTDPTNAESKPDWPTAVELVERVENPYEFRVTYLGPEIQFTRIEPGRRTWYLREGTKDVTTADGRFTVQSVIPAGPNSFENPAKVVLKDNFRSEGSPLTVVSGVRQPIVRPWYQATLLFSITESEVTATIGKPFQFEGLDYELTVTKITENFVEIQYKDDNGRNQKFEAKSQ